MAVHMRAQIAWNVGTTLARDVMQITPCFRDNLNAFSPDVFGPGTNWQDLADDLVSEVQAWNPQPSVYGCTVKLYQIKDPVQGQPNRPKAIAVNNLGAAGAGNKPRELACCLSFWGGVNGPRQRGRLYIPFQIAFPADNPGVRPTTTQRDMVAGLVPRFAGLGGADIDWVVWSPTNKSATRVDHWYVDDEWDVQRRRGFKPSTRTEGTTSG
jgi:hypothetical protein